MRLIDADALIIALETQDYSGAPETLEDWTPQDMTKAEIADIQQAPTIEAEPIRYGERIYKEYKPTQGDVIGFYSFECSECGCASWIKEYNYCPYCGARMDKGET